MRALPAYARSCRLIQAWTDEGAAQCSLAQQAVATARLRVIDAMTARLAS